MDDKVKVKKNSFKIKINAKIIFISIFIFLFLFFSFRSLSREVKETLPEKSITQIISDLEQNKIKSLEIIDNKIIVTYKNDKLALTYKETGQSIIKTLQDSGVDLKNIEINIKDTQASAGLVSFLANLIPTILLVAFFVFLFRQARGAQESVFSFGQARTKQFTK